MPIKSVTAYLHAPILKISVDIKQPKAVKPDALLPKIAIPVSYTHLTLPTKA